MNQIERATIDDKEEIYALYQTMLNGPADWNEHYPGYDTIDFDLSRDALFVMRNEKEIIAAISIDQDEEVERLDCWSRTLVPSAEFSRLVIREDVQGQGLSKLMVKFVLDNLRNKGMKSVHILVREGHSVALRSYKTIGFHEVGSCRLFGKDFICMEMEL